MHSYQQKKALKKKTRKHLDQLREPFLVRWVPSLNIWVYTLYRSWYMCTIAS